MDLRDRRYAVLLVSASEKTTSSLKALLPESLYSPVAEARDIQSARRALLENTYDIVIINTPFKDDFGTSLALNICDGSGSGVLLLVKARGAVRSFGGFKTHKRADFFAVASAFVRHAGKAAPHGAENRLN